MRQLVPAAKRRLKRTLVEAEQGTRRALVGSVRLDHFGVLDGRTLTLIGTVTRARRLQDDDLQGVLTKEGGQQAAHRFELPLTTGSSAPSFNVAIPLGSTPGALPLAVGRWRLSVGPTKPERFGMELHMSPDAISEQDGPSMPNPRSIETALRYAPKRDDHGRPFVLVKGFAPHAEVDLITVRGPTISFEAHMVRSGKTAPGADDDGPGELLLEPDDSSDAVRVPIVVQEGRFSIELPITQLIEQLAHHRHWEAVVVTRTGARLVLGKLLDDARTIGRVMRLPAVTIASHHVHIRVHPTFSRGKQFSLDVRVHGSEGTE